MTNIELKEWRLGMLMSQRQAAAALGITQSTYCAMERGRAYATGKPVLIDRRTELACRAIAEGLAGEEEKFGELGSRSDE